MHTTHIRKPKISSDINSKILLTYHESYAKSTVTTVPQKMLNSGVNPSHDIHVHCAPLGKTDLRKE